MSTLPVKKGIIGRKLGMTQVFTPEGAVIPVTIIEAGPCIVSQKKTDATDGYTALQLAFAEMPERKSARPRTGHFKKAGMAPRRHVKEFKLANAADLNVGDVISAGTFAAGDKIDVTGMTKGRGFSGTVKRWNTHMQRSTHGVGPVHRHAGSMGANSDPSRIMKNKKMAGQYGNERVTILNLEVVKVDTDKNLIAVRGAVPGAKGGIVFVRSTVK